MTDGSNHTGRVSGLIAPPEGDPWSMYMQAGDIIFTRASTKVGSLLIGGANWLRGFEFYEPHHVMVALEAGVIFEATWGQVTAPKFASETSPFDDRGTYGDLVLVLRHPDIPKFENLQISSVDEARQELSEVLAARTFGAGNKGFVEAHCEKVFQRSQEFLASRKSETLAAQDPTAPRPGHDQRRERLGKLLRHLAEFSVQRKSYPSIIADLPRVLTGRQRPDSRFCSETAAEFVRLFNKAGLLGELSTPGDTQFPILPSALAKALAKQGFVLDVTERYRRGLAGRTVDSQVASLRQMAEIEALSKSEAADLEEWLVMVRSILETEAEWERVSTAKGIGDFITLSGAQAEKEASKELNEALNRLRNSIEQFAASQQGR